MKFALVDRITELAPGRRIVAVKNLSLAEEYLADHFPAFPVMPGVLMLEALTQAAAWLVRATLEPVPALVVLKEARNVTYKSFVAPGQALTLECNCRGLSATESTFAASGQTDGRAIVKGQLTLRHLNLADTDPGQADTDEQLRAAARRMLELIWHGQPAGAVSEPA